MSFKNNLEIQRTHWLFENTNKQIPSELKTVLISVASSVISVILIWYVLQLKPPWVASPRLTRRLQGQQNKCVPCEYWTRVLRYKKY